MEFILQLMSAKTYDQNFRLQSYINSLKQLGTSIVCVQNEKRVKVHIHTFKPAVILQLSQKYGEFLTFKLENMQVQHNERDRMVPAPKHKSLSIVAVVNGSGMRKLFENLGADFVIDGGPTMNTSSKEFVSVIEQIDADAIVVLPNHKNNILAAEQAASLTKGKNVTVLPTTSYADGYFAIAMDMSDCKDPEKRIQQMRGGITDVVTVSETTASRDYTYHEISCRQGEEISMINGDIVCVNSDWKTAILGALRMVDGMDDKETCIVFRGNGIPEEYEDELSEEVANSYPMLELEFVDAGQEIYHWVIGIM